MSQENINNVMMYVCPKCGSISENKPGVPFCVCSCETEMIKTTISYDEFCKKSNEICRSRKKDWIPKPYEYYPYSSCYRELIDAYAVPNEMYDPTSEIAIKVLAEYGLASNVQNELYRKKRDAELQGYISKANARKPKCPTCGSTNIEKISTLQRGGSVLLFGLASGSIGKTFKCKKCGYKW